MMIQNVVRQLENILVEYMPKLSQISEAELLAKPFPHKWSKKQVVGHLVDSAQNNIRRFVVAQYEEKPLIKYAQDNWVVAANYENYDSHDLLMLWCLLNRHICMVLNNMPPMMENRICDAGELRSIVWLAEDYNKHLLHHLHQLLDLEEIAYP